MSPIQLSNRNPLPHLLVQLSWSFNCNTVLAGSPWFITNRLQRALNVAARVIIGMRKLDHNLSHLLHSELHWLDIPQRVQYKLRVTIHRCLQNRASQYLVVWCTCTPKFSSHWHLRSANRYQLLTPRHHCSKFGCRAFSVAGLMVWNSLLDSLLDPMLRTDSFRLPYKTHLFTLQWGKALSNVLYKSTTTTTATTTTITFSCQDSNSQPLCITIKSIIAKGLLYIPCKKTSHGTHKDETFLSV